MKHNVYIEHIAYALPAKKTSLTELKRRRLIDTPPARLTALGFSGAYIGSDHMHLAIDAWKQLRAAASLDPQTVDLLIYASALPGSALAIAGDQTELSFFKYAASKLQYDLGLSNAVVVSTAQQGCVSLMSAVWLAASTLKMERDYDTALCISTDVLPVNAKREIIYNVMSDAACAVLLRKGKGPNQILAYHQISKGYYWDSHAKKNEIVASYFPTAKAAISQTLEKAGLTQSDIDWIIPHNVSRSSWDILLGLMKFPHAKLYDPNMKRVGHTIAADNFINLHDIGREKLMKSGDIALLFTFGFGAHWSCMIVRH